jgi:hypothetical protein
MKKLFFLTTLYCLLFSVAQAQSVDILWQGRGYTPPFYQGRTLWSRQSGITLVAIPQGLGNSANLNYKWSRSGTVLGNISGVGKNSINYADSVLSRPQTFKVEIVSGADGETVLASASVDLAPIDPEILVYENHPLYGFTFHKETGSSYLLRNEEVTFTAFPLFFSAPSRTSNLLSYQWRTNAQDAQKAGSVTYRTPEGASGSARVEAHVTNREMIMQDVRKSFLVQFGEQ